MTTKSKAKMREKDLEYWKSRGGQIEWRIAEHETVLKQMKADLNECDEMIKKLKDLNESEQEKKVRG